MTFITVLPTGGPLVRRQRPAIDRPATASPGFGMLQSEQTLESRALNKHSNYGFTLVELMVTLAVLAIVVAIAVPNFTRFMRTNETQAHADELAQLIRYARSQAVSLRRNQEVTVSGSAWTAGNGDQERQMQFRPSVGFATGGVSSMEFNAVGVMVQPTAEVSINVCHVSDNSIGYLLTVNRSGALRIERVDNCTL